MFKESIPHGVNVWVHVVFGAGALLLGLLPLVTRKGGPAHIRFGRWFLGVLAVVLVTAALGIALFELRAFLAVITMLTAYQAYSGWRAVRNQGVGPGTMDAIASCVALVAVVLFLAYLNTLRLPWAPVVVYSTLFTLAAVATYDLARFGFSARWRARTWLPEHIVKMIGAYSGVVSAFSGTVLDQWQPYSQIGPSAMGVAAMIGFLLTAKAPPRDQGIPSPATAT
jgi:hypothetical protein